MALTKSRITGRVPLPTDETLQYAELTFTLSGLDTEGADILPGGIAKRVVLIDSDIPPGFDLWQNTAGLRGTDYRVLARWTVKDRDGARDYYADLGIIQVGPRTEYTLASLINTSVPQAVGTFWSALTQAQYDAVIQAASDANRAEAAALQAEAARDAAFVNANVYATTVAGLAVTVEGDQFQVVTGDEIIRYRHDAGTVATEVARYPSAGGISAENAAQWTRLAGVQARTIGIATVPNLKVGLREVAPDEVDFALNVIRGRWADNGLTWEADGRYADLALLPETIDVDGQQVVVTAWSFNLCPLVGYYKETGAAWPVPGEGGFPQMVVETEAGLVTVYHKTGAADQPIYIEQPVEHYVNAARNTDVWRTHEMFEATRISDGTFLRGQKVIQTSEVETAVQITGAADHAGGRMHGNEEIQGAAIWLVNGAEFDPADGATFLPDTLCLIQTTRLFNPGTVPADRFLPKGAAFMELTKTHTWDADGYTIRHHVNELTSGDTLRFGFFGMLPIIRDDGGTQITDTAVRGPYWLPEDVSVSGFTIVETTADHVKIWGGRYSGEVRVTEGWTDPSRVMWIQNVSQYNKVYPAFFEDSTYTMSGAEYDTEVNLNVGIKE